MKVKLWGVRGSLPAPHPPEMIEQRLRQTLEAFLSAGHREPSEIDTFFSKSPVARKGGYGGNTACVEVSLGASQIVIDGGSGIRAFGEKLMKGPCGTGRGEVHLFFTHFHWDHLIGLPFFVPLYVPGNKIHIHAVQPDLETCIRSMFKKPFFPVPFEELKSTIVFHRLEPRVPWEVGTLRVIPFQLDHPDPCWGYRVEGEGKAYAHCVDTECTRVSAAEMGPDLPLYKNADLVLFDAQYTLLEALEKTNWGHSSGPTGIDIALRENVKRILFAHHDPAASDEKIADAERQTREYLAIYRENARLAGRNVPALIWSFALEGQEIEL